MQQTERSLDHWQKKILNDEENNRVRNYGFPELLKYLMVEHQEYFSVLQRVCQAIDPTLRIVFRNVQTSSSEDKQKKKGDRNDDVRPSKAKPEVVRIKIAPFKDLGFDSLADFE